MIFEFAWYWFEDQKSFLFEGSERSQEGWKQDCIKAMRESGEEYLLSLKEKDFVNIDSWIEEFALKKLEEFGYKQVEPLSFGVFGGRGIRPGHFERDHPKIIKLIGEEFFTRVSQHNLVAADLLKKRIAARKEKFRSRKEGR